jgi:hypothetical protein
MRELSVTVPTRFNSTDGLTHERCVYWGFQMSSTRFYYEDEREYYMVTLYDDGTYRDEEVDHLHVGFYEALSDAERAICENRFIYCPLVLPWARFKRAARDLLDGTATRRSFRSNGFLKREKNTIIYTTACAIEYRLSTTELKALLT